MHIPTQNSRVQHARLPLRPMRILKVCFLELCVILLFAMKGNAAIETFNEMRNATVRTYLGVATEDLLHDGIVDVRVKHVAMSSAAAQAGITTGDFITKFDGSNVTNSEQLIQLIRSRKPGDRVIITVERTPRERGEYRIPVVLGVVKE